MIHANRHNLNRRGGVYLAVLGTALIASVLALSALGLQRIQNRQLTSSFHIRQAQLNAEAAIELGLLEMKQNVSWRADHDEIEWFATPLVLENGDCQLEVDDADAVEGAPYNGLSTDQDSPVRLVGIGRSDSAEQRVSITIDPRRKAHDCLKAGGSLPANSPIWQAVFEYYGSGPNGVGTEIVYSNLPNAMAMPNMGRNAGFESNLLDGKPPHWEGDLSSVPVAGLGTAQVQRSDEDRSGQYGLRVSNRSSSNAGASQDVAHFLKPETTYRVEVWVQADHAFGSQFFNWRYSLRVKTIGNAAMPAVTVNATKGTTVGSWTPLTHTLTSPNWTGGLEYAYLTISCDDLIVRPSFYMDDFFIRDNSSGRFIYKQRLGPGYNSLYSNAPLNNSGLYWINCGGQNLIVERSRIRGTLLILNPGPSSRVDYGPIHLSPHRPGYPTLLVNGNFAIRATSQSLDETENGVNYNPPGIVHKTLGENGTSGDIYPDSGINGLVLVSGNLTYANNPTIRGHVLAGSTPGTSTTNYQYQPDSLINPPPPLGSFYNYRYDPRGASVRKVVMP